MKLVTKEIKAKKRKREPHQEYTFGPIVSKEKKGGIEAVAYCDKILIDLLYPFFEEVPKANPTREVRLIEDNASEHKKAAKMCADIMKDKGIKKVEWLANYLDLHLIEDIWDQEKELLSSKWKQLRGAGKRVQD